MSENATNEMPSMESIVARHTAKATPLPSEVAPDSGTAKGGTASDPNVAGLSPEKPEAIKEVVEKVEAAKAEKAAEKPKEERDVSASRFGALARREKELRQRQQEIESKLKAAEERERALLEKEQRLASAKKNPIQVLKEFGFSYQDATEAVLGNYKEPEEDPVDAKIRPYAEKFGSYETKAEQLERELQELKAQIATKQQQESMAQVSKEITSTLSDEKFELTRAMGQDGVDFVRDIMVEYYKANERLLDYSEACQIAEDYYEKEYLGRLLETKKLKSRLPSSAAPAASQAKPKESQAKPTLTNDLVSGSGASVDIDKLSRDEAIEYLSKKLKFKS